MVYTVLFSIELAHDKDVPAFLKGFSSLQSFVRRQEPGTLSYEMSQPVEDGGAAHPRSFLVHERYCSQDDFTEVHLKSAAFAEFFQLVQSLETVSTSLQKFESNGVETKLQPYVPAYSDSHPLEAPQKRAEKGVLVLGGSRAGNHPAYAAEAASMGQQIVQAMRLPFIYGGGTIGLMGAAARAAHATEGGKVISIIPKALMPREITGEVIGDVIYFPETMSDRKTIMLKHCAVIIALPGGMGTFDELYEFLVLFQLNAAHQKIGLLNVENFFDSFVDHLKFLIKEGFVEKNVLQFFVVKSTAKELAEALLSFVPPPPSLALKW